MARQLILGTMLGLTMIGCARVCVSPSMLPVDPIYRKDQSWRQSIRKYDRPQSPIRITPEEFTRLQAEYQDAR